MPLVKTGTKQARSKNIAELIRSGRPKDQAVAIAFDVERRSKRKKPSRRKYA